MKKELKNMTEPELRELMIDITEHIKSKTDSLFLVLLFDEPGISQYISNANRADCINAMREAANRFENYEEIGR